MKKALYFSQRLVFTLVLSLISIAGWGQVYQHDFGTTTITTHPYTVTPNVLDTNLNTSSWTNSKNVWTSFGGSSGQAISLNDSGGAPKITLSFNVAAGNKLSITQYNFWRQRSTSGAQNWSMTVNGIAVGAGTVPTAGAPIGSTNVTNPVNNLTGTITVVISLSGASGTGTFRLDDFTLIGTVSSSSSNTITTSAITGSPFCVTASTGAAVSVPFTSVGSFTGNTYTAQLSNAAGSFTSPTNIGTLVSNSNSGTVSATIPGGTASGSGYRVRVVSNNPSVTGSDNGTDLTVNFASNTVTPATAQSILTGNNGTALSVTEQSAPTSREWKYSTTSGSGYSSFSASQTGTSYTPNFATPGTYYVICESVFACGTVTSNEVQVKVTDPVGNDLCSSAVDLLPNLNMGAVSGTMMGATSSANTFTYGSAKKDVWYTFTPTCTGKYTIIVNGFTGDIDVDVFSSSCPTTGTASYISHGSTPTETITNTFTAGTTYSVRVIAWDTAAESSTFNISLNNQVAVTTSPVDKVVTEGTNTTFAGIASANATDYQWQVSTDNGGNYTDITNGGVYSTATTPTLNITAATIGMNNYLYRLVAYNGSAALNCQSITSTAAKLTVNNAVPNNASISTACLANDQITLNWTAPTGTALPPTGYIVFAQPNSLIPQMAPVTAGNASSYTANSDYTLATGYFTLGKALYKGNATSVTITGLTNLSQYTFKVVAYRGETGTGWSSSINNTNAASSYTKTYTIDVPEITNLAATVAPNSSLVSWNVIPASVGCYEYLVVANQGAVTFTPSGNGSAYTANPAYSSANQVVYKGTGNSITVTGLTEGLPYCYKVFVREMNSNEWSDGTSVCQTTGLAYCSSTAGTASNNGITHVDFNTLTNDSSSNPVYSDFTGKSTTVVVGNSYDLSVRIDTYNTSISYVTAWIDWNRSGTFDANETYDLGSGKSLTNDYPSSSPYTITVPSNAAAGATRMRIVTKQDATATSCETYIFGETEDYTVIITNNPNAKINVKGNNTTIPNGSTSTSGLDNTQFGPQPLGSTSAAKSYDIENIGLTSLNLGAITLSGNNPTSFVVTQAVTAFVPGKTKTTFTISLNPLVSGVVNAIVNIPSNDVDIPTYTFLIQGTGTCSSPPAVAVSPTVGPVNTVVTLTSASTDLSLATIQLNGITITPLTSTTGTATIKIPANAYDGNLTVKAATGCVFTISFDVITEERSGCEGNAGGTNATNLIIYEIFDEVKGSGGFVSLYNGTSSAKDLSNYEIYRAGDVTITPVSYTNGLHGVINPGELKIIKYSKPSNCSLPAGTGNGEFPSGFNGDDVFQLRNADGTITYDEVVALTGAGYYMKRKVNQYGNNTTYNAASWDRTSGVTTCVPGAGTTPVNSLGAAPKVTLQPTYIPDCKQIILNVLGTEGYANGNPLAYQWFVLAPGSNTWISVSDGGVYSGATSSQLTISSAAGLDNYQYYAQVRENTVTCYTASNAVQIKDTETDWDGNSWSKGLPTLVSKVVLKGDYDTSLHGDFTACSLELIPNSKLIIKKGSAVYIVNDIKNNSNVNNDNFIVESDGNLIQENDASTYTGNTATVKRNASMKRLDYTYWTAPVAGQNLKTFSPGTVNTRFYTYNEWDDKFTVITPGNNVFGNNSDNAFESAAKGYAIRADNNYPAATPTLPAPLQSFQGIFKGMLNNGAKAFPLAKTINGYNLVGNPYPSNIDFYALADSNASFINKQAYFWTNLNPNPTMQGSGYPTTGYYNNYAILNGTGGIPATLNGVDPSDPKATKSDTPTRYIKVGQGFIVQAKTNGDLSYSNAFRNANDDSIFFNNKGVQQKEEVIDRFWLHLKTPIDVLTTQLIGYLPNATDGMDADYDAKLLVIGSDAFYSVLGDQKLGIQGKAPFAVNDVVPLGTSHDTAGNFTIYLGDKEGIFANGQNIYLKDKQTNTVTNLSEGSYSFTANQGLLEGRFEIIYEPETVLATDSTGKDSLLVYRDGNYFVIKSASKKITALQCYDAAGRLILQSAPNQKEVRIDATAFVNGIYVLKISQNGTISTQKVMR